MRNVVLGVVRKILETYIETSYYSTGYYCDITKLLYYRSFTKYLYTKRNILKMYYPILFS